MQLQHSGQMKKVIVLGNGFIASHLKYPKARLHLIESEYIINEALNQFGVDVVINATGFTGRPNVDECEIRKSDTYMGNVVFPCMLASECEKKSIQLIHLGSGCIYYGPSPSAINRYQMNCFFGPGPRPAERPDGHQSWVEDTGWKETDIANPISHYSKTKYACDLAIGSMKNVTTLRLRMPISTKNTSRNLLNKLLGYSKVLEEPNSVMFMEDLVSAIDWAIENEKTGIYHITSPKPLTHSMLLEEYKKYVPTHTYTSISKEELSTMTTAARSNCILDCRKATSEGFKFGDTDTLMRDTIKAFAENRK
jgi:dTDP-4-dehydrorhamnose reductase